MMQTDVDWAIITKYEQRKDIWSTCLLNN